MKVQGSVDVCFDCAGCSRVSVNEGEEGVEHSCSRVLGQPQNKGECSVTGMREALIYSHKYPCHPLTKSRPVLAVCAEVLAHLYTFNYAEGLRDSSRFKRTHCCVIS